MKIGYIDRKVGSVVCALILAGTIAGVCFLGPNSNFMNTALGKGFYTNDDVEKNKERLRSAARDGGRQKVKSFGKQTNVSISKNITK